MKDDGGRDHWILENNPMQSSRTYVYLGVVQKAVAVHCDVSDDVQVAALVDRTVAAFGRIDAAFNNAGVMARIAPIADSTREDWDRVIGINLRGVWSCMKHEIRHMGRQGGWSVSWLFARRCRC